MAVSVRVTRVACSTSTGDQDITISGFGTPKAALFLASSAVTDGTAADGEALSVGATDGTTQAVISGMSDHGVGTTDTNRRGATDEVVMIINNAGDVDGEANFSTWITDGVRITWGDAPAAAYLLTVVLFGGDDVSANVGNFNSAASGATNNVDCGFEPDAVFFFGNGTSLGDTRGTTNPFNLGIATNESGGIVNRATSYVAQHGATTSQVNSWMAEGRCQVNLNPGQNTPTISRALSVETFNASGPAGFTIRHHPGDTAAALTCAYLALYFGGAVGFAAGTMTTPTSTGNNGQTGPGFTPQFMMLLMDHIGTANSGVQEGVLGISTFTADEEYSIAVADEDNVGTTNTQSLSDDTAVNFPDHTGAASYVAAHVSMDASGWTLNFSAVDGSAHLWPYLAIEAEAGGGSVELVVQDAAHTHAVDNVALTQAHQLAVADSTHGHAADAVVLLQAYLLAIQDAAHGHSTDALNLGIGLSVADALHSHSADSPALLQAYLLAVADTLHGHSADNVGLLQAYLLSAADALHGHSADNVALTQAFLLSVADTLHAHTADNVALVQAFLLAVADALHAHTADNVALTQAHLLAVADALHAHTADNLSLAGTVELIVQDAAHGHSVDSPALIQAHLLAIADALHGHTAESPTLIQAHLLAVADALHSHAADNVALVQAFLLAVQDALHAHTADNLSLSGAIVLVIQDALHGHSADNVVLVQAYILVIADALHAHTADSPTLLQAHLLAVADSLHSHTADSLSLGVGLAVQDALHTHTAGSLALVQAHLLAVNDTLHDHTVDNIDFGLAILQIYTADVLVNIAPFLLLWVNVVPSANVDTNPAPNREVKIG